MARYLLTAPAYVAGLYHFASSQHPLELELANDVEPSRKWVGLDEAALVALERLGVKRPATAVVAVATPTAAAAPAPKQKRPSDRDAL